MSGRILIVDDVATNRIALKARLGAAQYDVAQARTTDEAALLLAEFQPDIVIIDLKQDDKQAVDFIESISKASHAVLAICCRGDLERRIAALQAGAADAISKPVSEMALLARLRNLLRARDLDDEMQLRDSTSRDFGLAEAAASFDPPGRIALLTGIGSEAALWRSKLSHEFGDQVIIQRAEEALNQASEACVPDVFVIPGQLRRPDDGLRMLSELRSRPETRHAGILMVMGDNAAQQSVIALDLGANDLLQGDFDMREMTLRIRALLKRKRQSDHLRSVVKDHIRLAAVDPLTGLYNRRYAFAHLERIKGRADRTGRGFALMMLDIDRFKQVNDRFGHAVGDRVLEVVAQRLRDNLRGVDLLARFGGEEFLVAMPETDLAQARGTAERLRCIVEEQPIHARSRSSTIPVDVTLSIGVTMGGGRPDAQIGDLVAEADAALYESKSMGRNVVTFCRSAA